MSTKLKVDLKDLRPTLKDVEGVLGRLSDSAASLDGISNGFYKLLSGISSGLCLELVNNIIDGDVNIDEDFNYALFSCIPKAPDEISCDGEPIFTAGSTRPISNVDASN